MNPDTCDDVEDAGDESPADWPPFKPGRPYGVYPTPPGLVRVPAPAAPAGAENPKMMRNDEIQKIFRGVNHSGSTG